MVSDSKLTITRSKGLDDQQAKVSKICQVGQILVGAAGDVNHTEKIFRWLKTKRKKPVPFPDGAVVEGLLLIDGQIVHMDDAGEPLILDQDFFAIGSGANAALGALHAGATPVEAVEIACRVDPNSEPPIQVLKLDVNR